MAETPRRTRDGWGRVISPIVDGMTIAAYFYFLPWLARSYLTPSWVNGLIIGFAFIMLLVAIKCLRELAHTKAQRTEASGVTVKVSPMFFTMAGSFVYCGFLAIVFLQTATKYDLNTDRQIWLHALSVLGIAMVSIVGMAFWESMKLADSGGSTEALHGIWKLIIFLLMVLVFAGFLGMPRIFLHLIKGDKWGLVTYMASLGYYVWDLFEF